MVEVRYAARARQDLREIFEFIAADNPRRAVTFIDELRQALRHRAEFPKLGRRESHLREDILFGVHANYVYYYQILGDSSGIRVLHVFHGARDHRSIMVREHGD